MVCGSVCGSCCFMSSVLLLNESLLYVRKFFLYSCPTLTTGQALTFLDVVGLWQAMVTTSLLDFG